MSSEAGKARYLGASSMYAWQFAKAQRVAATPFVSMQNHYNLVYREEEREMIPQCLDQGVGVIPWSPLARGLLAGNPHRLGRSPDLAGQHRSLPRLAVPARPRPAVIDRVVEVAAAAVIRRRRSRWPGSCTSPA